MGPFLSPRDLPNPGIEPVSPAFAGGFYTTEPSEKLNNPGAFYLKKGSGLRTVASCKLSQSAGSTARWSCRPPLDCRENSAWLT